MQYRTATEARQFAETWLPAWTGNNPEHLGSFYSEDAFSLDPATPEGVKGKAALIAYFRKLLAHNPNWIWKQIEGIPLEHGFLNKWRATIPVGSRVIEVVGVCFVQLDGAGKIRRNEVYFDRALLLQEIESQRDAQQNVQSVVPPSVAPKMKLEISNLKKGITWWQREKKGNWPQDFHNEVYYELFDQRKNGLTYEWWEKTVARLWAWRAIRSPKKPNTKDEIRKRGLQVLPQLQAYYTIIRSKYQGEPVFLAYQWKEIEGIYDELARIKGASTPNFPSKLGHFIFPRLFIVMDNQATGLQDYVWFWSSMRKAWNSFLYKEEAKEILARTIRRYSNRPINEHYPFEVKIIELCNIGSKQG